MSTIKVNTISPLSGGTVTIDGSLTETSALRYKENVQDLEDTSKVMQLRPVTFDWKKDQKHDIGLIAEEVAELYPELVETNGGITGIKYTKLTALLIKTVQDLNARIEELETQITKK
jgi:hypothetical protein